MELRDIFVSTMAGAAVVLMGAFYALFYALARFHNHRLALAASAASYLGLLLATFMLVDALALRGFWLFVVFVMLVGYLLAPVAIWRLCVDIHDDYQTQATEGAASVRLQITRTDP